MKRKGRLSGRFKEAFRPKAEFESLNASEVGRNPRPRMRKRENRREQWSEENEETEMIRDYMVNPAVRKAEKVRSLAEGRELMLRAEAQKVWGMASAVDIYSCDPGLIRDAEAIKRFVVELCDLIEMKRFGETQVVHFGEDERVAGYSMVQLIETSLISAHFANQSNTVYLDVFSCKPYNPQQVKDFAQAYFKGARANLQVVLRK